MPRRPQPRLPRLPLAVLAALISFGLMAMGPIGGIGGMGGLGSTPAYAERAIDAETFRPSLDGYGLISVERSETGQKWDVGFKFTADYAQSPLRLALHEPGMEPGARQVVMQWQTALHFGLHLGLTDWLELALQIPLSAQSYSAVYGSPYDDKVNAPTGFYAGGPRANVGPPNAGVLDPRVALKARTRRFGPLGMALILGATVPFGDDAAFLGDSGFSFRPTGVVDLTFDRLTLALNVGAIVRRSTRVLDPLPEAGKQPAVLAGTGHELTASLGAQVKITSWMDVSAEAYALLPLTTVADRDGANVADRVLGVLGALRFFPRPGRDLSLSLGGGAGLPVNAGGGPRQDAFRVLIAMAWTPGEGSRGGRGGGSGDRDGDGILDGADLCPQAAEDKDGFEDADGCPDPDNDGDGVLDIIDRCLAEPEDRDGFQDLDGCPDPDNDGDGISDIAPIAPITPTSRDGDASAPVARPVPALPPTLVDRCPDEPEDKDGFEDEDGCPDPDNDGDGIPDARDRCPNEAEIINGIDDDDGCPDSGSAGEGGAVRPGGIPAATSTVTELIFFDKNKSRPTAPSYAAFDRAARLLQSATRQARLEVFVDSAERKAGLGSERVRAVQAELVKRGVPEARIDVQAAAAPKRKAGARKVEIVIVEAGK